MSDYGRVFILHSGGGVLEAAGVGLSSTFCVVFLSLMETNSHLFSEEMRRLML